MSDQRFGDRYKHDAGMCSIGCEYCTAEAYGEVPGGEADSDAMEQDQAAPVGTFAGNRLIAELTAARDQAERHLEDPDNSPLSSTGMIRSLADAVSVFLDQIAAEWNNATDPEPEPEPAEQHEHHFPLRSDSESDPTLYPLDCVCGTTYQDHEADEFYRLSEQYQRDNGI